MTDITEEEVAGPTEHDMDVAMLMDDLRTSSKRLGSRAEQKRRVNETKARVQEENRLAEEAEAARLAVAQEEALAEGQASESEAASEAESAEG
jgi:hypothetical protein